MNTTNGKSTAILGITAVFLILASMLSIFAFLPYLRTSRMTAAHGKEFEPFLETSGLSDSKNAEIRVLSYNEDRAKVSFLSSDGRRESICIFHRGERPDSWTVESRRIVRSTGGIFSGILRSYLRMIGC